DDCCIGRRAGEVGDAVMAGETFALDHVDGDHAPMVKQVHAGRKEEGTAPDSRPGLDHELGSDLGQDLLIDPKIQGTLEHRHAEPPRVLPRTVLVLVVETMESFDRRNRPPIGGDCATSVQKASYT